VWLVFQCKQMPSQTSRVRMRMLEREMTAAGDRLRLAIAVENDFNKVNPGTELADLRRQWFECRRIVDQFAEDYVVAVQRWREAVMDSVGTEALPRRGTRSSGTALFQRFMRRPAP